MSQVSLPAESRRPAEGWSYELLEQVGNGSHGRVFKARQLGGEQRLLAVKKFSVRGEPEDGGVPISALREAALLRRMEYFNHPNIVKLLDVSVVLAGGTLDFTMILEFIDQDLSTVIAKAPASGLHLHAIQSLMQQLLLGVDFLHSSLILHRDLKPENVLVSSAGRVKVADFGLAQLYSRNGALTPGVVTLWYRAPEVLLNCGYGSSVDLWSVGCILAELFLLKPLFRGFTEVQQLRSIFQVIGLPHEDDWPEGCSVSYSPSWGPRGSGASLLPDLLPDQNHLLSRCLDFKPDRRISAAAALEHPFFIRREEEEEEEEESCCTSPQLNLLL